MTILRPAAQIDQVTQCSLNDTYTVR